jgi:cytochrome P450
MTHIPVPNRATGWHVFRAWQKHGYILGALEAVHAELGDIFRLPLPGFDGVFVVGPEANRLVLTDGRDSFRWRADSDPVTRLLRHGLLVEDGASHDEAREIMTPAFHGRVIERYVASMQCSIDQVTQHWHDGERLDLVVEMRRIALPILLDTLFGEDFRPRMEALWRPILQTIQYISPGAWLVWPGIPRPGYRRALRTIDAYLYDLIARRRADAGNRTDLVSLLLASGMSDDLLRDQLLTLLIAGHDTSTAQLSWSLYLLLMHPGVLADVRAELARVLQDETVPTLAELKQASYLDSVLKETVRLYPPIHLGSRIAATAIDFGGYHIPGGTRVLYSIYLSHRHREYWTDPDRFDPKRFAGPEAGRRPAYTYVPFGGGPRNCIGAAFAQIEAKVVLTRILARFDLRFVGGVIRPHMGATLLPSPGVLVEVRRRP